MEANVKNKSAVELLDDEAYISLNPVGDVLLRFRGEYVRFQNADDDYVPQPGENMSSYKSKMNDDASEGMYAMPTPADIPPAGGGDSNPFGSPYTSGNEPMPF